MDIRHKGFISYHHANDQWYKDELVKLNKEHNIFIDKSVNTGDIDEGLPNETIRTKIRDEYLRDSTVTILLLGTETKNRKHIDWELYSSMIDGSINKKSGILVINLPSISGNSHVRASKADERPIHKKVKSWTTVKTRKEHEERHPYMFQRLIDNFVKGVNISVVHWEDIEKDPKGLQTLIHNAHSNKNNNEYDLSRKMKERNS